jgi:uncharacterized protein with FMN-binding domain
MKKFVIGLAVFIVFGIYSLGIRHQNPVIGKPKSFSPANTIGPAAAASSGGMLPSVHRASSHMYKDGTYNGSVADAYYGNVQVSIIISGGKLTDIKILQSPDTHQTSVIINQQATPYLKQEAIQSQSSNVQIISGATFTSQAFQQSLQVALSQA